MSNPTPRDTKRPDFVVHQAEPLNGGSPPHVLRSEHITPTDAFYLRTHGSYPVVGDNHTLTVNGDVTEPLTLTLAQLRDDFEAVSITATLRCAGDRRQEMHAHRSVGEGSVLWGLEGISTATWRGARLRDVLERAGVATSNGHVAFASVDTAGVEDEAGIFGGSIPLNKALTDQVIIAYEMNGEPLPPAHGGPLRTLVPGYVAARSVKWLATITVQTAPSNNFYQQRDYKVFPPDVRADTVNWDDGEMLNNLQTDAVICIPADGATVPAGAVTIEGYAIPADGTTLERVELSVDDGASWQPTEWVTEAVPFTWRFWRGTVHVASGTHTVIARVIDSTGTPQPATVGEIWNFRGYNNNAWHRVTVTAGA